MMESEVAEEHKYQLNVKVWIDFSVDVTLTNMIFLRCIAEVAQELSPVY
jgi:hypothetical protein